MTVSRSHDSSGVATKIVITTELSSCFAVETPSSKIVSTIGSLASCMLAVGIDLSREGYKVGKLCAWSSGTSFDEQR